MRRHLGRSLDLLIEEMDGDGVALGTTGNYLKVRAYVSDARVKDIVPVSVAGLDGDVLIGHPIAAI
jgi:hypothetical protein